MPLRYYKTHKTLRLAINFFAGFVLFSFIFPFGFNVFIENVYDHFDSYQYLSIQIKESNYTYKRCEDIKLDITAKAEISIHINVEYRADLVEDSKTVAVSSISPETYTRIKRSLTQPKGSNDYTVIGFTGSQSCNWKAGTYRVVLFYNYTYRVTTRSYSVATVVTVTD